MKKKLVAALVIAMTMGVLAGCGDGEGDPSSPVSGLSGSPIITGEPEGDSSEASSDTPEESTPEDEGADLGDGLKSGGETHTIGARTEVDGKVQSRLTGEWKDAAIANRRNMAIMIPNNKRGGYKDSSPLMKQYGISSASIIYEAPVEGRITRLMAVFEDYDDLEFIGPVRSSRDYYIHEAMSFDSIYVNWGLAIPWVEKLIESKHIDNISTDPVIDNSYDRAFERNKDLMPGSATEFTGVLNVQKYTEGVEARGYEKEYRDTFVKTFEFADDGYLATYDDFPDATKVYPGGGQTNSGGYGSHKPCFEYNPEDRLYYRSQWGEPHTCGKTGEQLTVTNVIFKVCHGSRKEPNNPKSDYLDFVTDGSGNAYVFTNGKVIEGTWERKGASDPSYGNYFNPNPTIYYDKNGNEIVLNQGKTWICCIWDDYEEWVSWE
ncbi:MAG: DUF3048 domain-containing protein [Butyrivibrio sp.]|nr:DUF3048 domain-containing protein [Acetatifactor muris]MCM1559913.1 DUF3048 domain-containing protein [Butyrivibrio sp.]